MLTVVSIDLSKYDLNSTKHIYIYQKGKNKSMEEERNGAYAKETRLPGYRK